MLKFRDTLHMLAEGEVDPRAMVTGEVGLPGVTGAFDALAAPEAHAKILIDPRSDASEPCGVRICQKPRHNARRGTGRPRSGDGIEPSKRRVATPCRF